MCFQKLGPIPAVVSQNVDDKSCLVYVFRVKKVSWVTLRPLGSIEREETEVLHILKLASVFHHLPSVGPKQLCALAHLRCTRKAGTS